jgi:hypothetical protein
MKQKKWFKTASLAALALAIQATEAKAQAYTTEVYDFEAWATLGSYASSIDVSSSPSLTNTSGQTVYVETAQFGGNALSNGAGEYRFAHTNNLLSSNKGLLSGGDASNKQRYLPVINLQVGDVVYIEGGSTSESTTMQIKSDNAAITSAAGTVSAIGADFTFASGVEYTILSGNTLDLFINSSSASMRLTKVIIKKLNTALAPAANDADFDFKNWMTTGSGGYTSSLSDTPVESTTSGATVYAEQATFYGHDMSRIATSAGALSASGGLRSYNSTTKNRVVSLLDVVAGDKIEVTAQGGAAITITVNSEESKPTLAVPNGSAITGTFTVSQDGTFDMGFSTSKVLTFQRIAVRKPYTLTIGSTKVATFSSPVATDFGGATGLEVYKASSYDSQTGQLSMTRIEDGIVPANTGVMLFGAAGEYTYYHTTTDAVVADNLLQPITSDACEVATAYGDNTTYLLALKNADVAFYPHEEAKSMLGGKAYLLLPTASGARSIMLNFSNEATAIKEATTTTAASATAGGSCYNLQGQQVAQPARGIYIINGKKVFIK